MAKLVLFGASDIARLANFYFARDSEHEVVAFAVDAAYRKGDTFEDLPLVDFETVTERYPPTEYKMFVAVSYTKLNAVRAERYEAAKAKGYELVSYVSSRCSYLSQFPPGDNCFILEDNTIQPYVRIGNDVTLWSGNHIGHDSVIEDHCFLASHIVVSGWCKIEPYCFIGVNVTLRNGLTIGRASVLGAGALIMKDTAPKSVYSPRRTEALEKTSDQIAL